MSFDEAINSKELNYRCLFVCKLLGNIPLDAWRLGEFDVGGHVFRGGYCPFFVCSRFFIFKREITMSVKKLLTLTTAAGVALVGMTAIAGGPDQMAPPAAEDNYFYVEGNAGYASQDFAGTTTMVMAGAGTLGNGSQGGAVFGGDIGYMFTQHLGVEAGWTYLPRFHDLSNVGMMGVAGNYSVRSTSGSWLVLKLLAPVTENVDAFFKAGLGYRRARILWGAIMPAAIAGTSVRMEELRPLFAVGGSYNFGQEWMASLQFMHFMGGTTYNTAGVGITPAAINSVVAPSSNVVTLGVGYKFTV